MWRGVGDEAGAAAAGFPQTPQNRNPACRGAPHPLQRGAAGVAAAAARSARGFPQSRQNAKLASFSRPQCGHVFGFTIPAFRHGAAPGSTR